MDQDKPVITSQPIRSSQHLDNLPDMSATFPPETQNLSGLPEKSGNGYMVENITEVTAVFPSNTGDEEEKQKRQEQLRSSTPATDCCCVYVDDDDPICWYLMCRCICDMFRGIGVCTENCFESCASCLNDCCDGSGNGDVEASGSGCLDCCSDGDGCGDGVSDSADCCTGCDCDCFN